MIDEIDVSYMLGKGGFMLLGKDFTSKKVNFDFNGENMMIGINKKGNIAPVKPENVLINDKLKIKKVPKDFYFTLSNDFYDMAIKEIYRGREIKFIVITRVKNE